MRKNTGNLMSDNLNREYDFVPEYDLVADAHENTTLNVNFEADSSDPDFDYDDIAEAFQMNPGENPSVILTFNGAKSLAAEESMPDALAIPESSEKNYLSAKLTPFSVVNALQGQSIVTDDLEKKVGGLVELLAELANNLVGSDTFSQPELLLDPIQWSPLIDPYVALLKKECSATLALEKTSFINDIRAISDEIEKLMAFLIDVKNSKKLFEKLVTNYHQALDAIAGFMPASYIISGTAVELIAIDFEKIPGVKENPAFLQALENLESCALQIHAFANLLGMALKDENEPLRAEWVRKYLSNMERDGAEKSIEHMKWMLMFLLCRNSLTVNNLVALAKAVDIELNPFYERGKCVMANLDKLELQIEAWVTRTPIVEKEYAERKTIESVVNEWMKFFKQNQTSGQKTAVTPTPTQTH
ncbi:MAG: hypothetical protein A3I77_00955 [Gammaproteobacteria bacterium RIFCSPLOWO2_02_FULL_42_14]|nr:MAG: hypothetical protein A3B71_04745 [Gammaproteobacteria bacterium RIFCSPHIGHO2_02_FULL_42_43]OGT28710.1 MAG: hypothetical protein A2624_05425 [Gammaproteobacteria bacterium RIFCSPHIGHO2_01_FULL_42_8]OGT60999.1 MAG: hypothetical protein A3I77_00955 [Gammaproteobacteria bacterium RIFCSPLOWO2_02_FULL_42_14]OGT85315.1 MAG: hypothetical protein A3G86_05590 [Gammaproteobacteria bacterium RIFCSPLOWO2_12_FULL_42_18]